MHRTICCLGFLLVTLVTPFEALAGDLLPPAERFKEFSTVAGWDFVTDQNIYRIRPDANVPLVVGDAEPQLRAEYPSEAHYPLAWTYGDVSYTPDHGGGYFSASPDSAMVFTIPSNLDVELFTEVRLQVVYLGEEAPPTTVTGYVNFQGEPGPIEKVTQRLPATDPSLPAGSSFFFEDWWIPFPSPWLQVVVHLPEGTTLLHVVIDTYASSAWWLVDDDGNEIGVWEGPK